MTDIQNLLKVEYSDESKDSVWKITPVDDPPRMGTTWVGKSPLSTLTMCSMGIFLTEIPPRNRSPRDQKRPGLGSRDLRSTHSHTCRPPHIRPQASPEPDLAVPFLAPCRRVRDIDHDGRGLDHHQRALRPCSRIRRSSAQEGYFFRARCDRGQKTLRAGHHRLCATGRVSW